PIHPRFLRRRSIAFGSKFVGLAESHLRYAHPRAISKWWARFRLRFRHCERGEAIQRKAKNLDCFVAEPVIGPRIRADPVAPRNDDGESYSTRITLTSLTLVSVGPVCRRSPVATKNEVASLLSR